MLVQINTFEHGRQRSSLYNGFEVALVSDSMCLVTEASRTKKGGNATARSRF